MNLGRKRNEFFIPVFSMSDIAFLLLIFIMITALINFRKEIKIEYPEAKTALNANTEKNLEVWINMEGEIFLNGEKTNHFTLERIISDIYINAPDTRVHIIADRNTPYFYIDNVLEILQLLQYRVVSFTVKNNE